MDVPNWWQAVLLSLAAFRVWKILGDDLILDGPRRRLTRLGNAWQEDGDPVPPTYRVGLGNFLSCPWCLGFHCAWVIWLLWQIWPHGVEVAAAPLAISAVVGVLGAKT